MNSRTWIWLFRLENGADIQQKRDAMPPKKTMLHILKTPPDDLQQTLMGTLSQGYESLQMPLFKQEGKEMDYEELLDLIFESDEVVSWW